MILGIDPGVKNIGISVFDGLEIELTTLKSDTNEFGREAMFNLLDRFNNFLEDNVHCSFTIFMEDYGFGARHLNMLEVECVGIILNCLHHFKHTSITHFISPSTVKKLITGNGKATKTEIKRSLELEFSSLTEQHDNHALDALGLLLCHKKYSSGELSSELTRSITGRKIYLGGK